MHRYHNFNRKATREERELGRWLDQQAQKGNIEGVRRVFGLPEKQHRTGNPDYGFSGEGTGLDAVADAVIAKSMKFESILNNALGKVGRQANNIVIELGKGQSAHVPDKEVLRCGKQVFKTSLKIRRLLVVRRYGLKREFVFNAKRPPQLMDA